MAQLVKNPPAMQETWVPSLGWKSPLEKGKAAVLRLPTAVFWLGEFHGLYSPWGCKELDVTERLSVFIIQMLKFQPLITQNVTVFGDRIVKRDV